MLSQIFPRITTANTLFDSREYIIHGSKIIIESG